MSKEKPDFNKPIFDLKEFESFKVAISQTVPFDLAFGNMTVTDYELLTQVIYLLNKLIDVTNNYTKTINEVLEWLVNEGLNEAVLEQLNVWLVDGTLEQLINDTLFNTKLDKASFEEFMVGYRIMTDEQFITNESHKAQLILLKEEKLDKTDFDVAFEDLENNKQDIMYVNVKKYGAKGDGITDDTIAIQNCLNENDLVYLPKGTYNTTKSLYFNRSRVQLVGDGAGLSVINKTQNGYVNLDDKDGYKFNNIDAVLMCYGEIGDFRIEKLTLQSTANRDVEYGFYSAVTWRFVLEDLYVRNCGEGIRCLQTWNTNIRKVRVISCEYGFRIDSSTPDPLQSTSINFDNTFAESCDFGYKFVNLTYFTGNAMSSDFIKECAFWFHFSSGAINGLGFEASPGQIVRNWLSNIVINGLFGLDVKRTYGLRKMAKTFAKFEVWSENRINTGLSLNGGEVRSSSGSGDSTYISVSEQSYLNIIGCRFDAIANWGTYRGENSSISSSSYYREDFDGTLNTINGVQMNSYVSGYTTETNLNHEGVHIRRANDTQINTYSVPLSLIRKRYPNFMSGDTYVAGLYKVSIYYPPGLAITDMIISATSFSKINQNIYYGAVEISNMEVVGENLVISFNSVVNYFDILITR